jgi:hypothetical protein
MDENLSPEMSSPLNPNEVDRRIWNTIEDWLGHADISDWQEVQNDRGNWQEQGRGVSIVPIDQSIMPLGVSYKNVKGKGYMGKDGETVTLYINEPTEDGYRPWWSAEFDPKGVFQIPHPDFYEINRLPPSIAEKIEEFRKKQLPPEGLVEESNKKHVQARLQAQAVIDFYASLEANIESSQT